MSESVDQLPAYDIDKAMQIASDEADLAQDLAFTFLEETPEYLAELVGHIEAGDAAEVKRVAHYLKGAASNIGAERFFVYARGMEERAREGVITDAPAELEALKAEYQRFKDAVDQVDWSAYGLEDA